MIISVCAGGPPNITLIILCSHGDRNSGLVLAMDRSLCTCLLPLGRIAELQFRPLLSIFLRSQPSSNWVFRHPETRVQSAFPCFLVFFSPMAWGNLGICCRGIRGVGTRATGELGLCRGNFVTALFMYLFMHVSRRVVMVNSDGEVSRLQHVALSVQTKWLPTRKVSPCFPVHSANAPSCACEGG